MNRQYWKGTKITSLQEHEIFVFGSNPEARHGAGAAKQACAFGAERSYGKKLGVAHGRSGQTYAIVTKNLNQGYTDNLGRHYPLAGERSVSKEWIMKDINTFYDYASKHPELDFLISYQYTCDDHGVCTKSLNGYDALETFDMFYRDNIPPNVIFHESYQLLLEARINGLEDKYHFFVHTQDPGSQWHPSLFIYKDRTFISCEQFMMYSKAMLFGDAETAEKILSLSELTIEEKKLIEQWKKGIYPHPEKTHLALWNNIQKTIKNYGRLVKNFDELIWDSKKQNIVYVGNREKFYQNKHLTSWMYNKRDKIFVEAAWYDKVWGIGLGLDDARRFFPHLWQGENLLGEALQKVCKEMYPANEHNIQP